MREGRGKVPKIVVYYTNRPSEVPDSVHSELGWFNRVEMKSAHVSCNIPFTSTIKTFKILQILFQNESKYNQIILFVKSGFVFEPNRVSVEHAERQSGYLALHNDPKGAIDEVQKCINFYGQSRKLFLSVVKSIEENLRIVAMGQKNLSFSNKKECETDYFGEIVIEGCVSGYCRVDPKLYERPDELYFYPTDYMTASRCHSDIGVDGFKNNLETDAVKIHDFKGTILSQELIKIAIGVPVTSKGCGTIYDLALIETLVPSIIDTLTEEEVKRYQFNIFIGFDEDDALYDSDVSLGTISKTLLNIFESKGIKGRIIFVRMPMMNRVAMVWNHLYERAMIDGCGYFYQVNDDLKLITKGWLTKFVTNLDKNSGIGVAGPADQNHGWECSLLTQAMVTSQHYKIFGMLYPIELKNWTTDRWLTEVYRPKRVYCEVGVKVANGNKPRRYNACDFNNWMVYVDQGRKKVAEYCLGKGSIRVKIN